MASSTLRELIETAKNVFLFSLEHFSFTVDEIIVGFFVLKRLCQYLPRE